MPFMTRSMSKHLTSDKIDEMQDTIKEYVELRLSQIPNSGNGLFAKVPLKKLTPLGWYEGTFHSVKDCPDYPGNMYCFSIGGGKHTYHCSGDSKLNMARYANDAVFHKMYRNNIQYTTQWRTLPNGEVLVFPFAFTTRDIKAGEELFGAYGSSYWTSKKINDVFGTKNRSSNKTRRNTTKSKNRRNSPNLNKK